MRPRVLILVIVALASQVGPWRALLPHLPPAHTDTRSPSSDVLLGALPLPHAAERVDAIAATLPRTPGVVVGHGTTGQLASAYFVLAMRLWPRAVSFVTCEPTPAVEQFRVPHQAPAWQWRIDMRPGTPLPVSVGPMATTAEALCRR